MDIGVFTYALYNKLQAGVTGVQLDYLVM